MSSSEFKRLGEARDRRVEIEASLEPLFTDGLITEVLGIVRKGKEANVYCCRGSSWTGREFVAAKIYRAIEQRGFRNDASYQQGRDRALTGSAKRALANKSRQGRIVQSGVWVHSEYETLMLLHQAGADVPAPIACVGQGLLMEFIGDGATPAPMLSRVAMAPDEAQRSLRRIVDNIALWLTNHRVHGDLSPYNILYRDGDVVMIDFPQAVDPRFNENARSLLERDLENVCAHFARAGLRPDPQRIAHELWRRYRVGDL
ncbi:MAG TPA: RIO1 family regulatory kinase/ATPase [Candidatus Binataceae bacterium]